MNKYQKFSKTQAWKDLDGCLQAVNLPENHLKNLISEPGRLEKFSIIMPEFFYDFSRQRVDDKIMGFLFDLAESRGLTEKFNSMIRGEKLNITEKRSALHTATRNFSDKPVYVDNKDIMPDMIKIREDIKKFSEKIHNKSLTGSSGKPFKHAVVIGIGGSYLGTEFVSNALHAFADKGIELHYLSNVDIHNFGRIISETDPETTLWIVVSKSYTTAETMANTKLAYEFVQKKGLDPAKHFITVTSKGSPGDDPSNPVLGSFNMFDFIGGRYSVTSAVGGVPLSLYLGYDKFERFLKGAGEMDTHAATAPLKENIPLIAALISIWNNNFLGYGAQGIIPYASPLCKLAPHIQQLNMESNGKSVTTEGETLKETTGMIIFGEPGTNAQHSFFQLAHQGRPFPIDFIGVVKPQYEGYKTKSKGVTNHQELWSNMLAQSMALAKGKDDKNAAKHFSGNRPSSTIILDDLSPESTGRLLSFYEAKTVFEAFVWGINPFDQFGVELGKTMASDIRKKIEEKNKNKDADFKDADPVTKFYLNKLFE